MLWPPPHEAAGAFFYVLDVIGKDFRANCRFVPFMAGGGYAIFWVSVGERMDEYLTIFEVAELTKYRVGTLRKFVLKRRIAFHKWGRALRFKRTEIELWIKGGATEVVYLPDDTGGKPETAKDDTASTGGDAPT
jgi:excisionase family DNA binding protein